jgi:hypothetical protein
MILSIFLSKFEMSLIGKKCVPGDNEQLSYWLIFELLFKNLRYSHANAKMLEALGFDHLGRGLTSLHA